MSQSKRSRRFDILDSSTAINMSLRNITPERLQTRPLQDKGQPPRPRQYKCDSCHASFTLTQDAIKARPVPELKGVTEHGIECPHCHNFFHSAYSNAALDLRRGEIERSRGELRYMRLATYQRDYMLYQQTVLGALDALKGQPDAESDPNADKIQS